MKCCVRCGREGSRRFARVVGGWACQDWHTCDLRAARRLAPREEDTIMERAGRVYGILDLQTADAATIVRWTAAVMRQATHGEVSLMVARDQSHVLAVAPELACRLEAEQRAREHRA